MKNSNVSEHCTTYGITILALTHSWSFLIDQESLNLHICSPAIIQNSELSKNPHTKFCPPTYAQTPEQVPFSGSFSINPTCLSSFEFQSQSLQHSETSMLYFGSTSMCYNSRVPQSRKAKVFMRLTSYVSLISGFIILYYLLINSIQQLFHIFYSVLQFLILGKDGKKERLLPVLCHSLTY